MAEGLRDHQESNESEVCDDVIDVPNPIPSLLDSSKFYFCNPQNSHQIQLTILCTEWYTQRCWI